MWYKTTIIDGKLIIYIASGIELGPEAKQLLDLVEAFKGPSIELLVNSEGGSVAVANTLRKALDSTKRVTRAIILNAKSAAWNVLMAAPRIEMTTNATAMIHVSKLGLFGNAREFRTCADSLAKSDLEFCATLHQRRKIPIELAVGWLDGSDHHFDAAECLRLGLVDEIIQPKAQWPGEPDVNAPSPLEDAERAGELFQYLRRMPAVHLKDPETYRGYVNMQLARIIL